MIRLSRGNPGSRGFTLIELLVTMAIIGILASMVIGALAAAQEAARRTATRTTIVKLDQIIMERYESYQTRRVSIKLTGMPGNALVKRLGAIRDLMRLEMPQGWVEVEKAPLTLNNLESMPSLAVAYRNRLKRAGNHPSIKTYGSAECLYMIVTMGTPEGRTLFSEREVGDVDGDGLPEFVDGWGNPIYFLRWPAAFNDSDMQANIIPPDSLDASGNNWKLWDQKLAKGSRTTAAKADPDPFGVGGISNPKDNPCWRVMPLIVSAGPDGIFDITTNLLDGSGNPRVQMRPHRMAANEWYFFGLPEDQNANSVTAGVQERNESLDHYDNIHNHRLEVN